MCIEKISELPDGDPDKKLKGRVVFQGNNVWDANYDYAVLQDLPSNPATMEAAKAADFVATLPRSVGVRSDAAQ
eukprot:5566489-Alexandrium_andersonii.AAC.1